MATPAVSTDLETRVMVVTSQASSRVVTRDIIERVPDSNGHNLNALCMRKY